VPLHLPRVRLHLSLILLSATVVKYESSKCIPCASISTKIFTLNSTSPSRCAHLYQVPSSGRSVALHLSRLYVLAIRSKKRTAMSNLPAA